MSGTPISQFDLEIAARTAWMEARGEPYDGECAVIWTFRHRLARPKRFGQTLAAVCLQPFQYSCWNTRDPNRQAMAVLADDDPELVRFRTIVDAIFQADMALDPVAQACFYYARGTPEPDWAFDKTPCAEIGNHLFFNTVL
jgi:N-acetylmuramoyl-L-alanine amidase